jgi:TRAP transporter TAXI family solute receptor
MITHFKTCAAKRCLLSYLKIACLGLTLSIFNAPMMDLSAQSQSDPQSAQSTLPQTTGGPITLPPVLVPNTPATRTEPSSAQQKPLRLQSNTAQDTNAAERKRTARPAAGDDDEQQPRTRNNDTIQQANNGVVSIISGGADGTYIRIASDMANLLDETSQLRILPMIGRGSLQNIRDILFLRGVDIGIVQMDSREGLRKSGLYDEAVNQLRFIARLYNEEVHIVANTDIKELKDLTGKKVNVDVAGSGTSLTAKVIFEKFGITPEFTTLDPINALEKLKNGEIQAAVFVAGRPMRGIREFKPDGRFHILSIPFDEKVAELYLPARLTTADYPQLIDNGKPVDTLSVGNVLAVYNWPENSERYQRVERFVTALFSKFDEFLKPGRHPKWREVNLSADVPGWKRFKPAQEWLDKTAKTTTGTTAPKP